MNVDPSCGHKFIKEGVALVAAGSLAVAGLVSCGQGGRSSTERSSGSATTQTFCKIPARLNRQGSAQEFMQDLTRAVDACAIADPKMIISKGSSVTQGHRLYKLDGKLLDVEKGSYHVMDRIDITSTKHTDSGLPNPNGQLSVEVVESGPINTILDGGDYAKIVMQESPEDTVSYYYDATTLASVENPSESDSPAALPYGNQQTFVAPDGHVTVYDFGSCTFKVPAQLGDSPYDTGFGVVPATTSAQPVVDKIVSTARSIATDPTQNIFPNLPEPIFDTSSLVCVSPMEPLSDWPKPLADPGSS